MSSLHFSRWLALVGILGGVCLATCIPLTVLLHGKHLSAGMQLTAIITSILSGALLAAASAVVGITIPTAILDGKLDLERLQGGGACCEATRGSLQDDDEPGSPTPPA